MLLWAAEIFSSPWEINGVTKHLHCLSLLFTTYLSLYCTRVFFFLLFNCSDWGSFTLTALNASLSWAFSTSVHRPSPPRRSEEELNKVCGWGRGEHDTVGLCFVVSLLPFIVLFPSFDHLEADQSIHHTTKETQREIKRYLIKKKLN